MKNRRRPPLVGVAIGLAIGALMFAAGGFAIAKEQAKPVIVANTASQPVPVAGTATVSGSVALAPGSQVGLADGSHVSIDGQPTVAIADPASHPFQQSILLTWSGTAPNAFGQIDVPAGKRLVIEHVSGSAESTSADEDFDFVVQTTVAGNTVGHLFPSEENRAVGDGAFVEQSAFSNEVRLYADGGGLARVGGLRGLHHSGSAEGEIDVSGYLIDLP